VGRGSFVTAETARAAAAGVDWNALLERSDTADIRRPPGFGRRR
jgi:hypothetical protein